VFPGDANADGIADLSDLISIGIAHGNNGPVRPSASLNWVGQACPDWSGFFGNGVNYKHADCNGDGTINDVDTIAIGLNLGLTHNKGEFENPYIHGVPNIIFDLTGLDTVLAGDTLSIPIKIGDITNSVTDLYGLTFDVNYDTSLIKNNAYLDYTASWLGTINSNMLQMQRNNYSSSKLAAALTKKDQINVTGFGEIASLNIIMEDNLSGKTNIFKTLNLSFSNVKAVSLDNSIISLNVSDDSLVVTQADPLSSKGISQNPQIELYPNPSNGQVNLRSDSQIKSLCIMDLQGRIISKRDINPTNQFELDLNLTKGMYLINVKTVLNRHKTMSIIIE
jgi:hypothetical protein